MGGRQQFTRGEGYEKIPHTKEGRLHKVSKSQKIILSLTIDGASGVSDTVIGRQGLQPGLVRLMGNVD